MLTVLKRLIKEEEGQGLVEYALIIALVSVALITVLVALKENIESVFEEIGDTLSGLLGDEE